MYSTSSRKGGCSTGQAEVTTAGNLPAQYLIHAVGPRWLDGERNEPQLLCDAYSNAIMKANRCWCKNYFFSKHQYRCLWFSSPTGSRNCNWYHTFNTSPI